MESPKVHQTVTILYGAFLASSFVYVMVAVFLQTTQWRPVMPQIATPLFAFLLVVAMVNAGIMLRQKRSLFSSSGGPPVSGDFRQFVMSRCIVWFALSEVPAILGFVFFILAGSLGGMLALVGVSAVSFTLAKPTLAQLEELERRQ